MDYNSTRSFTMTLAHRAVGDIRRGGFRQLRNYVDMCATLAKNQQQKDFFAYAQKALQRTDSCYYSLIHRLLDSVDEDRICTVGVNMGFGGLIYGASELKKQADLEGQPIAWITAARRGIVDKPLVVTIRTRAEGGELALTPDAYAAHCRALLARGGVDVLDIEWRACGAFRAELRDAAHAAGAAALFSEHHFDTTPATDAMADTLTGMADAGADIAKLAVMPRCAADAARLLEATARAADARPDTPLITMSMGPLGAVTRFCGGAFGSCATFGVTSGTSASAPGQPPADLLKAKLITAPL